MGWTHLHSRHRVVSDINEGRCKKIIIIVFYKPQKLQTTFGLGIVTMAGTKRLCHTPSFSYGHTVTVTMQCRFESD